MTTSANPSYPLGSLAANAWNWAVPRFLVYVAAAGLAALLFVAGAGVYVLFSSPPDTVAPDTVAPPAIEIQKPTIRPEPIIREQGGSIRDLIAKGGGATTAGSGPLQASVLLGTDIYGPDNKRVGKVTEIVMDRKGNAQGVVFTVDAGNWRKKKEVILPFNYVTWKSENTTGWGIIPYTADGLQKLPLSSYPMMMRDSSDK